jgi:hypothetical protein
MPPPAAAAPPGPADSPAAFKPATPPPAARAAITSTLTPTAPWSTVAPPAALDAANDPSVARLNAASVPSGNGDFSPRRYARSSAANARQPAHYRR